VLAITIKRILRNAIFACVSSPLKQLLQMLDAQSTSGRNMMKVERLSFLVSPSSAVKDFLTLDKRMWDPWLRMRPGFIQKTATVHPGGRIEIQIFWKSKEDQHKAADNPELPVIEATFRNALGPIYRLLYSD